MPTHPIILNPDLQERLERIAAREVRSPEFVLRDAIQMYANAHGETEEEAPAITEVDRMWDSYGGPVITHEEFVQEGLASLEHSRRTGLHLSGEEVVEWIERLRTDPNAKSPECHT